MPSMIAQDTLYFVGKKYSEMWCGKVFKPLPQCPTAVSNLWGVPLGWWLTASNGKQQQQQPSQDGVDQIEKIFNEFWVMLTKLGEVWRVGMPTYRASTFESS